MPGINSLVNPQLIDELLSCSITEMCESPVKGTGMGNDLKQLGGRHSQGPELKLFTNKNVSISVV